MSSLSGFWPLATGYWSLVTCYWLNDENQYNEYFRKTVKLLKALTAIKCPPDTSSQYEAKLR